jgi:hypothetical protein
MDVLKHNPASFDLKYLRQFPEYAQFIEQKRALAEEEQHTEQTPRELLEESYKESFVSRLRSVLAFTSSLYFMGYLFAGFVVFLYVVSLLGALFDMPLGALGDMMSPIRYSLFAWFLMSCFYLMAQAATKRWNGVVLGGISLATSAFSYLQAMTYLQSIQVPWFVSTLRLEPATKVLVSAVFGIALLYVFLSPMVWERYLSRDNQFIIRRFLEIYSTLHDERQLLVIKERLDLKD